MAPHPIMKVKGTDCTERYSLRSQSQFENRLRNDVWNIGEIATGASALAMTEYMINGVSSFRYAV